MKKMLIALYTCTLSSAGIYDIQDMQNFTATCENPNDPIVCCESLSGYQRQMCEGQVYVNMLSTNQNLQSFLNFATEIDKLNQQQVQLGQAKALYCNKYQGESATDAQALMCSPTGWFDFMGDNFFQMPFFTVCPGMFYYLTSAIQQNANDTSGIKPQELVSDIQSMFNQIKSNQSSPQSTVSEPSSATNYYNAFKSDYPNELFKFGYLPLILIGQQTNSFINNPNIFWDAVGAFFGGSRAALQATASAFSGLTMTINNQSGYLWDGLSPALQQTLADGFSLCQPFGSNINLTSSAYTALDPACPVTTSTTCPDNKFNPAACASDNANNPNSVNPCCCCGNFTTTCPSYPFSNIDPNNASFIGMYENTPAASAGQIFSDIVLGQTMTNSLSQGITDVCIRPKAINGQSVCCTLDETCGNGISVYEKYLTCCGNIESCISEGKCSSPTDNSASCTECRNSSMSPATAGYMCQLLTAQYNIVQALNANESAQFLLSGLGDIKTAIQNATTSECQTAIQTCMQASFGKGTQACIASGVCKSSNDTSATCVACVTQAVNNNCATAKIKTCINQALTHSEVYSRLQSVADTLSAISQARLALAQLVRKYSFNQDLLPLLTEKNLVKECYALCNTPQEISYLNLQGWDTPTSAAYNKELSFLSQMTSTIYSSCPTQQTGMDIFMTFVGVMGPFIGIAFSFADPAMLIMWAVTEAVSITQQVIQGMQASTLNKLQFEQTEDTLG